MQKLFLLFLFAAAVGKCSAQKSNCFSRFKDARGMGYNGPVKEVQSVICYDLRDKDGYHKNMDSTKWAIKLVSYYNINGDLDRTVYYFKNMDRSDIQEHKRTAEQSIYYTISKSDTVSVDVKECLSDSSFKTMQYTWRNGLRTKAGEVITTYDPLGRMTSMSLKSFSDTKKSTTVYFHYENDILKTITDQDNKISTTYDYLNWDSYNNPAVVILNDKLKGQDSKVIFRSYVYY